MKLGGLKVIELSWFLPGPFLAMALADHGAEVIKVEPPGEGDPGRHIAPMDARTSAFFRNLNRGKKSVVIDLKTAAGREAVLRLCDRADVVVESFVPASRHAWVSTTTRCVRATPASSIARSAPSGRTAHTPHGRRTTSRSKPSLACLGLPWATTAALPFPAFRSPTK